MPKPRIPKTIFHDLEDFDKFKVFVQSFYNFLTEGTGIKLTYCPHRQLWAFNFWHKEIARISEDIASPDHFKRAGFLAFWLRRECPVLIWDDTEVVFDQLDRPGQHQVDRLINYGREFGAFLIGYEICLAFECNPPMGGPYEAARFAITDAYIKNMMEYLKSSIVSPHSMYMIYWSLFNRRQN